MISLHFSGGKELAQTLNSMAGAVSHRVKVRALTDAAEPIREAAAAMAPRDPLAKGPHLADNIVVSSISMARQERNDRVGESVVEVGPARRPSDHFYGFFQEFGTARHQAQAFMRPAFDANWQTSLRILQDALWREIAKHRSPYTVGGGTGFGSRAA